MEYEAPKIDPRTASDVFKQVVDHLLEDYKKNAPETDQNWKNFEPGEGVSGALISIFARYGELIIERLNQVPEKNLLAFLDLLGASLLPPHAARVPLTFSLAEGATVDVVVPAGTQVAALAIEAERDTVVFETERDLMVTPVRLTAAFARNIQVDKYADYSFILPQSIENRERETPVGLTPAKAVSVFECDKTIDHILYIAHDPIFNHPGDKTKLEIKFVLSGRDTLEVIWETWDGVQWKQVAGVAKSITTDSPLSFKDFTPSKHLFIEGVEKRWLRCRAKDAATPGSKLPVVNILTFDATYKRDSRPIGQAFTNSFPVDGSRGFHPFGESPRVGDVFYLRVEDAFAELNCTITIKVALAGALPSADPVLILEFWNGTLWEGLGTTSKSGGSGISDSTNAFTKSGNVVFTFSKEPASASVNGVEGYWVRARISSGSYGPGASLKPVYDNSTPPKIINYESTPAAAPLITSITVSYETKIKDEPPEIVLAYNDFAYEMISRESLKNKTPFTPFQSPSQLKWKGAWKSTANFVKDDVVRRNVSWWVAKRNNNKVTPVEGDDWALVGGAWKSTARYVKDDVVSHNDSLWVAKRDNKSVTPGEGDTWALVNEAFYLGFDLPAALGAFPNSKISIYACASGDKKSDDPAKIEWEYWTGGQWAELIVRDGTSDFTQPGLIEFLAPPDFAPRREFGLSRYWLRAVLKIDGYKERPGLSCLLLNTMMASHATSVKNEPLGSSDGSKNLSTHATFAPVLEGQRLEVGEPDLPPPTERDTIIKENGEDAISIMLDEAGWPAEVWVRWREVPDFYGSGPRDRHYTIDHLTGEIRFGDGLSGMIPPTGEGNIRMASYRTGGGAAGNRPAGSITEIKTTVPYVEKVINHIAASGGAEAETYDSLLHRMPRAIRHGGRAVTFEDYEDLAMLASPEVARAKCVQSDLGKLKLVVVPNSTDDQPVPSPELKRRVLEFIGARKSPLADIEVISPEYVEVGVTVRVAPVSLEVANDLRLIVAEKLTHFLHPLTGGFDGIGWNFGRQPHLSDLHYLIETIPGVDHIINLVMNPPENDKRFDVGDFLISSGKHSVTCEFKRT